MNILWIIGNGFDLNLGLKTGYQHFLENTYLKADSKELKYRDELIKRVDGNPLFESDNWSDLEKLLGEVTLCYEKESGLFHSTFEEIGNAFKQHVQSESDKFFSKDLTDSNIEEFWKSIARFPLRLSEKEKGLFGAYRTERKGIKYQFVSLNYTTTLEEFISAAKQKHQPFDHRGFGSYGSYDDGVDNVLHPHGTLENDEMVFGVSDESQLKSESFHNDEARELWVKELINDFYGNLNVQNLFERISEARQIFMYGVSLGESDNYIWRQIGKWLASSSSSQLVFFSHGFPSKESFNRQQCRNSREEALDRIRRSIELDTEHFESIKDRVLILPSTTVFRFGSIL